MPAVGLLAAFALDDVLLCGIKASATNLLDCAIVGKPMTIELYVTMLPKADVASGS